MVAGPGSTVGDEQLVIVVNAVQGYLHLRPATAEKFGAWFAAHLAGLPLTRRAQDVVLPFKPRHTA